MNDMPTADSELGKVLEALVQQANRNYSIAQANSATLAALVALASGPDTDRLDALRKAALASVTKPPAIPEKAYADARAAVEMFFDALAASQQKTAGTSN